jgi:nicotinamide-nucleotide amidase
MVEQNRLVSLNLLGFDPDTALILTKPSADRNSIKPRARRHIGGWSVLECEDVEAAKAFAQDVCALFAPKAFVGDPFAFAVERLKRRKETIAFAESCTGGLLAGGLTAIAGASDVFEGSLVTYSNRLKTAWLGVKTETLASRGAVSEACVKEMASGTLTRTGANAALAISGIAGPSGGSPQKPIGTVFVGYAYNNDPPYAEELHLSGSRQSVRNQAVFQAIRILLSRL